MSEADDARIEASQRPPSKSARKREMHGLQKMGETLLKLPASTLASLPLSDRLREALALAGALKPGEGRRRQLQFIGKLMRTEETGLIAAALAQSEASDRRFRQHFHRLEQLRDRLLDAGDLELDQLMRDHPELDAQRLRQLIRMSRRETEHNKAPAASRRLFKYLRENLPLSSR